MKKRLITLAVVVISFLLLISCVTGNSSAEEKSGTPDYSDSDFTGELIEKVPNFAGAYIDTNTGALIATDIQHVESDEIDLEDLGRWSDEVYHMFDYSFFYENLKENVGKRIATYVSTKP